MIPPITQSAFLAGQKPMELPKNAVEHKKNGTKIMRPSGVVIGEPSLSVAASVLEQLAQPYRLPLSLDQLRQMASDSERAAAVLLHGASNNPESIDKLVD